MDRNTILLDDNMTQIQLGRLLDEYGAQELVRMIPKVYKFQYPKDFKKYGRNWSGGRPFHHLNQNTGCLKKNYRGTELRKIILNEIYSLQVYSVQSDISQKVVWLQRAVRKKLEIKHTHAAVIQKYIRRFLVSLAFKKAKQLIDDCVDFDRDCITYDSLTEPCIIRPDYMKGNFVIYNKSTIEKLTKTSLVPAYFFYDSETNQERLVQYRIVERDIFQNIIYESPFTRIQFTRHDVTSLDNNLIFQIGRCFSKRKNKMEEIV